MMSERQIMKGILINEFYKIIKNIYEIEKVIKKI